MPHEVTSTELIENHILRIRSQKVILDTDLADLYAVTTKRLNEQVKRNIQRFPEEFMFKLTDQEKKQVVANCDHLKSLKFSHTNPNAFTEHGVIMAASILNTPKAIEVSVLVVKTFVKLRELLSSQKELRTKLKDLENKLLSHDRTLRALILSIRRLLDKPKALQKRRIGFESWEDSD